jgi:hypothetical protein
MREGWLTAIFVWASWGWGRPTFSTGTSTAAIAADPFVAVRVPWESQPLVARGECCGIARIHVRDYFFYDSIPFLSDTPCALPPQWELTTPARSYRTPSPLHHNCPHPCSPPSPLPRARRSQSPWRGSAPVPRPWICGPSLTQDQPSIPFPGRRCATPQVRLVDDATMQRCQQ